MDFENVCGISTQFYSAVEKNEICQQIDGIGKDYM